MAESPLCKPHLCRPNTKPTCKGCIKTREDAVAMYRRQGQILPTKLTDWPTLKFMGREYRRIEPEEEEHF
ncbi:MAG: hypothetical protein RBS05_18790 [Zoogloea oleivorans]|jgi:hypothetical protein|uniref:hypothetical protein n=1 Tax=Zoogloea oleivorans TaxID=1552750 RepID=UPI002A35F201|nr:hypothetical protein [Zoogloea oleivorans]MDY0037963.1 hypothetical protein [Zoogloea oleivorans]